MTKNLDSPYSWRHYLQTGAGDQIVAKGHGRRYILELLQNARDAMVGAKQDVDSGHHGRTLIAVTERGILAANTGEPFDLACEKVQRGVQFLTHSPKTDAGTIGHKGIGLRSILMRAESLVVRSSFSGRPGIVGFSRSQSARSVLASLVRQVQMSDPAYARKIAGLVDGIPADLSGIDVTDTLSPEDVRRCLIELPQLPLFAVPYLEVSDILGDDAVIVETACRAVAGVDSPLADELVGSFTTGVYLGFLDREWERILDRVDEHLVEHGEAGQVDAFRRRREEALSPDKTDQYRDAWEDVRDVAPETYVLLGGIEHAHHLLFSDGKVVQSRDVTVDRPLTETDSRVQVRVKEEHTTDGNVQERWHRYLVCTEHPACIDRSGGEVEPTTEPVRLLFELPAKAGQAIVLLKNASAKPLHLYYPVDHARTGLPFIIHGPFRVNSNRTDLAANEYTVNSEVLHRAYLLLKETLPEMACDDELRTFMPWLVAPVFDEQMTGPISRFRAEYDAMLMREPITPTGGDGARLGDTLLFDPRRPRAYEVVRSTGREPQHRLLAAASTEVFAALHRDDQASAERIARRVGLGGLLKDPEASLDALMNAWERVAPNRGAAVKASDPGEAVEYFHSVMHLLTEQGADGKALAEKIGTERVPLVPAAVVEGGDQEVFLVRVEPRQQGVRGTRVLFWRPPGGGSHTPLPSAPAEIPIFLAEESAIGPWQKYLSREGYANSWDTTQMDGLPDLLRRVGEWAARVDDDHLSSEHRVEILAYILVLLHLIDTGPGAEETLVPEPLAYARLDAVKRLFDQSTAAIDFERRQLLGAVQLPAEGGDWIPARELVFGTAWKTIASACRSPGTGESDDDESGTRWADAIEHTARFYHLVDERVLQVAPPHDRRWHAVRQFMAAMGGAVSTDCSGVDLFRWLLVLGVNVGPRIRWMWSDPRRNVVPEDLRSSAIARQVAQRWSRGEQYRGVTGPPHEMLQRFCSLVTSAEHHPAFTARHTSKHCHKQKKHPDEVRGYLTTWAWWPDLEDCATAWSDDAKDAFCTAVQLLLPELEKTVLYSGWTCTENHTRRSWQEMVPSLAAAQLRVAPIWPARGGDSRYPATALIVRHDPDASSRGMSAADALMTLDLTGKHGQHGDVLANALGIDTLDRLSPVQALTCLSHLMLPDEDSADDEGPGIIRVPLPEGVPEGVWAAAVNQLHERLGHVSPRLASLGDEEVIGRWRRRSLRWAHNGCIAAEMLHDGQRRRCAVLLRRGHAGDGPGFAEGSAVIFPDRRPTAEDLRYTRGQSGSVKPAPAAVRRPRRNTAAFTRLMRILGAEDGMAAPPPEPVDTQPLPEDAHRALENNVQSKIHMLVGVLTRPPYSVSAGGREERAAKMLSAVRNAVWVRNLAGVSAPGSVYTRGGELAIVCDRDAGELMRLVSERPAVAASGLAQAAEAPTVALSFTGILSGNTDEELLRQLGVEVDQIRGELRAVAPERLRRVVQRLSDLHHLLHRTSSPGGCPSGPACPREPDHAQRVLQALRRGEGQHFEYWVDRIQELGVPSRHAEELVHAAVRSGDDLDGARAFTLSLVAAAEVAIWRDRLCEILRGVMEGDGQLARLRDWQNWPSCVQREETLRWLSARDAAESVTQRLSEAMVAPDELLRTARDSWAKTALPSPIQESADFMRGLETRGQHSGVRFLFQWEGEHWKEAADGLRCAVGIMLDDVKDAHEEDELDGYRALLDALRDGRLPSEEDSPRPVAGGGRRAVDLEALRGPLARVDPPARPYSAVLCSITSGRGKGGGGGVTRHQAVRGRIGEMSVIGDCWGRFLRLDAKERSHLLQEVKRLRTGDEEPPWSSTSGRERVLGLLATPSDQRLLLHVRSEDTDADAYVKAWKRFMSLLDVSGEYGVGFDVIDPFGVRSAGSDSAGLDFRRVEVKSVKSAQTGRIFLTVNEYHRARQAGADYVLRIVEVPEEEVRQEGVRLVADIEDPVGRGELERKIVTDVRGGGYIPLMVDLKDMS